MPALRHSEKVEVEAPLDIAFALATESLTKVDDDPSAITGHRPLDEGPVREGFRWRQHIVHNRRLCSSHWCVTELAPPHVFAQTLLHYCADSQRELRGGERWAFRAHDDVIVVELSSWRESWDPTRWLQWQFGVVGAGWA